MIQLFLALAPKLATSRQALTPSTLAWGARRCTQKAAEALCRVTPDIDADELRRRVRGFSQDDRLQLRI
ncbi:hypothetical protein JZU48_05450, partial [bacterium]|nr:hypothetical protein [bacterium]